MPFVSRRPKLKLTEEDGAWLRQLSQSRSEAAGRVQRAQILWRYHSGETVSAIAAALRTHRPRVERCIAKALELGVRSALQDLPGRGRRPALSAEARAWVVALACQQPKELGYAQELWTTRLLAKHVRKQCSAAGHPSLQRLSRGTVSKILRAQAVQPHKIRYRC
jgi:transposase